MKQGLLLSEFGRISNSPDAIARFRRFILDLAVRGRLVDQNPSDTHADQLVDEIVATPREVPLAPRYRSLVHEPITQPAFELPKKWAWTRLGLITDYVQRGKSPEYSLTSGPLVVSQKCVRWEGLDLTSARSITTKSLELYEPVRYIREGDLLWNSTGTGTIGRLSRVIAPPDRLVCDSHVTIVRCSQLDSEFLRCWLRSDCVFRTIEGNASGSTNQVELTMQMALSQPVPLPPLAEQYRIVAKVEELMTLCDRLEVGQKERELQRDALRSAVLYRLSGPVQSEVSKVDINLFVDTLPRLTTQPEHLIELRQAILDLGVKGMLVPQKYAEPPNQCDSTGVPGVPGVAGPFDLPQSWHWSTVAQLGAARLGKMLDKAKNRGTPRRYLRNVNVRWFDFDLSDLNLMPFEDRELEQFALRPGDVLICEGGEAGRAAVWDGRETDIYFQKALHRVRLREELLPDFFVYYLRAAADAGRLAPYSTGATFTHLTGQLLASLPIPVPPKEEQERIVNKIVQLTSLICELERAFALKEAGRANLLESLIHEELNGSIVPLPLAETELSRHSVR